MKTIIIIAMAFLGTLSLKAEEPEKVGSSKKNVEFTRSNFANNLIDLKFAIEEIKIGDQFAEQKGWNFIDALPHYLNAYSVNPNNALLNYKIGISYLNTLNKSNSLAYLEEAYALDPEVSPDILFQLGKSYHMNYQFDKAIENYQAFLSRQNIPERRLYYPETEMLIMQARNGMIQLNSPKDYLLIDLGQNINTSNPDYCPVISPDGKTLYFTSRRPETKGGERDARDRKYNEDVFVSSWDGNSWSAGENNTLSFNTESHDATVGISSDGNILMIYRGNEGGDLYFTKRDREEWSPLNKFPETINSKYKESSAIFSPDGSILYFTSDRPGGFGGLDIWISYQKMDGGWTSPVNAGPSINTQYDEEGVSINEDGNVLYFSSKGHTSMGGYDVFKSYFVNGSWSSPENLGYPLNTPDDDVFFTFTGKEEYAYFSSERTEGIGSQDIYAMKLKETNRRYKINLNAMVTDKISGERIESAALRIIGEDGEIIGEYNNIGNNENISVELEGSKKYRIEANAQKYFAGLMEIQLPEAKESGMVVNKNLALVPADIENVFLPVVFFDFDKYDLRQKSIEDLNEAIRIINMYPSARVVVEGHTDIIGSFEYNTVLSYKRAEVVKNYLINNGIAQERIIIDGYSYNMPWAPNITDEGRQINRRTEIRFAPMQ